MNKLYILTLITLFSLSFLLNPNKVKAADVCSVPDEVGTLSVGSDSVAVRWSYTTPVSADYTFQVAYAEAGGSFGSFFNAGAGSPGVTDYDYTFTGLTSDTTYYWKLRVSCSAGTNNDILSGFITVPTLDITGFLFSDGTITLNRRVQILSDFSYLRSPIWEIMTESVGSGRLHIVDVY